LFLEGPGKVWYDFIMNKSANKPTDWAELSTAFLVNIVPKDEKKELKTIMEKRVQGNETVDQYLTHKQCLCLDFNPAMPFNEMKDYLIEGMNDEIKAMLVATNPSTLVELIRSANNIEKGLKMANKLNYSGIQTNSNIEKNLEQINTLLSKISTESTETRERLDNIERNNNNRDSQYDSYGRRVHDHQRGRNRARYANHSRESSLDYASSHSRSRSASRER